MKPKKPSDAHEHIPTFVCDFEHICDRSVSRSFHSEEMLFGDDGSVSWSRSGVPPVRVHGTIRGGGSRIAGSGVSGSEVSNSDVDAVYVFTVPHHYSAGAPPARHAVPYWAEIALLFILPKKLRETLPGDLAEEFNENIVRMGRRMACIWYWWQVFRSVIWLMPLSHWLMQKLGW